METLEIIQEYVRDLGYHASGASTGYVEVSSGIIHIASIGINDTIIDMSPPGHSWPIVECDLHDPDSFKKIEATLRMFDNKAVHSVVGR